MERHIGIEATHRYKNDEAFKARVDAAYKALGVCYTYPTSLEQVIVACHAYSAGDDDA